LERADLMDLKTSLQNAFCAGIINRNYKVYNILWPIIRDGPNNSDWSKIIDSVIREAEGKALNVLLPSCSTPNRQDILADLQM
jgi:hypothetical protein